MAIIERKWTNENAQLCLQKKRSTKLYTQSFGVQADRLRIKNKGQI